MKLVPDVEGRRRELFNQFLNQPGVLQQLKGIVESVKEQRLDKDAPLKHNKKLTKPQTRSPRPPKSPLASPRHSTTTPRSTAESPGHLSTASPLLTKVSPRKDEPYFSTHSPRHSIILPDFEKENTPTLCQKSISKISSPALLDISKPNIESAVSSHQKIKTLSLKLSALNISSPTTASVGNNNINVNYTKSIDDSLDTENIDDNKEAYIRVSNDKSRTASVDTNEKISATASSNESSNAPSGNNDSISAIVRTHVSVTVATDSDTVESRNATVDTNDSVSTLGSVNVRGNTSEAFKDISVNTSEAFKDISVSDFSISLSLREEQSINLSDGTLDNSKFVTLRRRLGCSNLLEVTNNGNTTNKINNVAHVECNSECDHTVQKVGSEEIPQFFPYSAHLAVIPADLVITIQDFFSSIGGHLKVENCGDLCEKLGLHSYLRTALFCGLGKQLHESFTCTEFLTQYQAKARFLMKEDAELVAFHVISAFKPHVEKHHLAQIIMDIVMNHSYFEFCRSDFNKGKMLDHYKDTVVASVLFAGDGWRQGKLTLKQFQNTQFLHCLNEVSSNEDLTRVPHFSYDQFYVIYSRFLNLDDDEDFMLGRDDLLDYDEYRILTDILVERIFKVNLQNSPKGLMAYEDFVIFIKSEIDRFCPGAIHYWFNVLDLDDDGYLSFEELQIFYVTSIQLILISSKDIQSVSLTDMYTELTDTVYPSGVKHLPDVQDHTPTLCRRGYPKFSLHQLRNCHIFPHILDAFLNIFKFIDNDESCQSMLYNTDSKQVWNDYLDLAMKRIDAMLLEEEEEEEEDSITEN